MSDKLPDINPTPAQRRDPQFWVTRLNQQREHEERQRAANPAATNPAPVATGPSPWQRGMTFEDYDEQLAAERDSNSQQGIDQAAVAAYANLFASMGVKFGPGHALDSINDPVAAAAGRGASAPGMVAPTAPSSSSSAAASAGPNFSRAERMARASAAARRSAVPSPFGPPPAPGAQARPTPAAYPFADVGAPGNAANNYGRPWPKHVRDPKDVSTWFDDPYEDDMPPPARVASGRGGGLASASGDGGGHGNDGDNPDSGDGPGAPVAAVSANAVVAPVPSVAPILPVAPVAPAVVAPAVVAPVGPASRGGGRRGSRGSRAGRAGRGRGRGARGGTGGLVAPFVPAPAAAAGPSSSRGGDAGPSSSRGGAAGPSSSSGGTSGGGAAQTAAATRAAEVDAIALVFPDAPRQMLDNTSVNERTGLTYLQDLQGISPQLSEEAREAEAARLYKNAHSRIYKKDARAAGRLRGG